MAQEERKNWRELCKAALRTKDPDDVLKILQELNQALKSEEQVRRDFREALRTTSPQWQPGFQAACTLWKLSQVSQ